MQYAGNQTLSFSKTILNPVFSYVSLNANGYAFDRDFDILSFSDGTNRNCGYWGCGTSAKQVVTNNGITEYQLVGTGEPHGTIQFRGAYDTISWRSLTSEYWNGFTFGVQGVQSNTPAVTAVPEPSNFISLGLVSIGVVTILKKRRIASKNKPLDRN
ncbi:PEP-CTERM sorting domain-containing protein [Chamaesiphon polymorphus]|uniref:PEP-CTERM sorting domain-containing protein n=1 Tax=Chamaesiphon polymorphus TaxID=2107691 RepID=UPI001C633833|nr:PEP-CTERM sorting domain-containing protein [Chamaesiphon polymorphus]